MSVNEILSILANGSGSEISEIAIITSIAVMMLAAGVCSVIFHAIKLPPIIGYLIAGIIIANVLKAADDSILNAETVVVLKNIGLILLMFCIGTELSIDKIKKTGKFAALVAVIQLPLMVLSGYIFGACLFGLDTVGAITLGAVISGSSTAVVTAVLKNEKRISSEDAETLILVTIVEDIGQVIILSMVTPLFVGGTMNAPEMIVLIVKIIVFIAVSAIVGLIFVPKFLNWLGEKTSKEILLIFSVGLCFGMAWLSTIVGLSAAIGAFLMGMMTSQSIHAESLEHKLEPMKDIFMSVFFISVGMEITIDGFVNSLPLAIGIFLVFMISKFATVFLGYFVGGKGFDIGFVCSVSLMAMGEFAFIISSEAYSKGAVTSEFYSAVIGAALMSMIALPIISKKMFVVVDAYNNSNGRFKSLCNRAYGARDSLREKINSSPSLGELITKNLKKSYVCILLIIVIEIVFITMSPAFNEFLFDLLSNYIQYDGLENIVRIIVMIINFLLLVIPTYSIISSIKLINDILKESDENKGKDKTQGIINFILNASTMIIVFTIDFLLMAVAPGPFGDKSSLIVIPISIVVFALITFISWELHKRKEKKKTKE